MKFIITMRQTGLMAAALALGMSFTVAEAPDGFAQTTQTVTAEGMAGAQGNPAIARDNAIQDALRKAVEQAVGTMVSSETLVENFQVVRDNIYNKSQGYVKEYKIVKESPGKDLYAVTISATVSTENLKNDLGALGLLIARVGKPRTLFMVAEQNIGQEILLYWWGYWGKGGAAFAGQSVEMAVSETVLKEEFLNRGFNVIDISAVTGKFEISNAYRIADLTDTGAREIGRKMGAEIIIKGKALAKEGPRTAGSSVGSYLADITLSAVRVDNGQVLASVRGNAAARHVAQHVGGNQAIENAARQVADKLVEQITAKWTAEMSGGQLIQLTIRGLGGMKDLIKIKEFLKSKVRGVQNVIQRSFEKGEAVLEVDAKSSAQQIGDELAAKPIQGLDLDITAATGNTLELCVAGKCGAPSAQPSAIGSTTTAMAPQGASGSPAEDRHWVQPDDFFTSEQPYAQEWIYVYVSKKKQEASAKTKNEAQFFRLHDSKELWTKYFWQTRPAEEADLKIGTLAICFESNEHDQVYRGPVNKDNARTGSWFMGRVTDASDLFKGWVRIATYNCSPDALRIPIR